MSSEKQLAANRLNALKSSGPRSREGKQRSALNALRHGLTGEHVLVPGEDPELFGDFRQALLADLAPAGAVETMLADNIAANAWRLRRAKRMEGQVIEVGLEKRHAKQGRLGHLPERYEVEEPEPTPARVVVDILVYTETYDKICRYEAHLARCLQKDLHELQRLQAARGGERVPPPAALDVDIDVGIRPAVLHGLAPDWPAGGAGPVQGVPGKEEQEGE